MTTTAARAGVNLGQAILGIATKSREASLAKTMPALAKVAEQVVASEAERRAQVALRGLIGWLEAHGVHVPPDGELSGLLGGLLRGFGFAAQTVLSTAIGFGVGGALTTVLEPFFTEMAKDAWGANPVRPHSPENLANMVQQAIRGEDQASEEARRTGFDRLHFQEMIRLAGDPPGPAELLNLWNRGEIDEDRVTTGLRQSRIKMEWIETLKALRFQLVTPSDLIRFMVREVFNPSLRQKFGYDDDYTEEATARGREIGVRDDLLRDYWAAHWTLPSPTQMYDMFHRGEITQADLMDGLKAADYPSYWRPKLAAIAHRIPTRVDTRRMFEAGVIGKAEVRHLYRSMGYDDDHSDILTEFAVALKLDPEKDLVKAEVVTMYREGVLVEGRAREALEGLGYDREEADLILGLVDAQEERKVRDHAVNRVRSAYTARKITEDEAQGALAQLLPEARVRNRLLAAWDEEREVTVREPTEAMVRLAWQKGLVTEEYYPAWLAEHGYNPGDVELMVRLHRRAPEEAPGT